MRLLKIRPEFRKSYNEKLSGILDHKEAWGIITQKSGKISKIIANFDRIEDIQVLTSLQTSGAY
jgi:hypothetical protein